MIWMIWLRNHISANDLLWFLVAMLVSATCVSLVHGEEPQIKQRYELVLPMGPAIGKIKPGYFREVSMTDSELVMIVKQKDAELELALRKAREESKLEMEKRVAEAKANQEADRLKAENRFRNISWVICCIGMGLFGVGIVLAIWVSRTNGIKAMIAGALVGGTFAWIAMHVVFFTWGIIGVVALIVLLFLLEAWSSGALNKALEASVESGEVMKSSVDWKNDKKAKAKVRRIQGADPNSEELSWIERKIAAVRAKRLKMLENVKAVAEKS